jgi:sulfate-transporting ATPase
MGLTNWRGEKLRKQDVIIAKNYLDEDELGALNNLVEPMSDDEMNQLIERQGELQEKIDYLDAWDLDARLEIAIDGMRCPPGDTPINVISGGEKRRVALCRLLLQKPDILLLDEPTNHDVKESIFCQGFVLLLRTAHL